MTGKEVNARIASMLRANLTRDLIYQECEKPPMKMSVRQVDSHIKAILTRWKEQDQDVAEHAKPRFARVLEDISFRALQANQWHAALRGIELQMQLSGCLSPQVVNINTLVQHPIMNVSVQIKDPDAARARISELLARHPEYVPQLPPKPIIEAEVVDAGKVDDNDGKNGVSQ